MRNKNDFRKFRRYASFKNLENLHTVIAVLLILEQLLKEFLFLKSSEFFTRQKAFLLAHFRIMRACCRLLLSKGLEYLLRSIICKEFWFIQCSDVNSPPQLKLQARFIAYSA